MKLKMLAYKDTKLGVFGQPFYMDGERSNADIIEITRRMCANPELPVVYFQYDLYDLGLFDDKIGSFDIKDPEYLCSLGDFAHLAASKEERENARN